MAVRHADNLSEHALRRTELETSAPQHPTTWGDYVAFLLAVAVPTVLAVITWPLPVEIWRWWVTYDPNPEITWGKPGVITKAVAALVVGAVWLIAILTPGGVLVRLPDWIRERRS